MSSAMQPFVHFTSVNNHGDVPHDVGGILELRRLHGRGASARLCHRNASVCDGRDCVEQPFVKIVLCLTVVV